MCNLRCCFITLRRNSDEKGILEHSSFVAGIRDKGSVLMWWKLSFERNRSGFIVHFYNPFMNRKRVGQNPRGQHTATRRVRFFRYVSIELRCARFVNENVWIRVLRLWNSFGKKIAFALISIQKMITARNIHEFQARSSLWNNSLVQTKCLLRNHNPARFCTYKRYKSSRQTVQMSIFIGSFFLRSKNLETTKADKLFQNSSSYVW